MRKIYGAYQIAEFLGLKKQYIDVATLLRVVGAPLVRNERNILTYCVTEDQAIIIKITLQNLQKVFKS